MKIAIYCEGEEVCIIELPNNTKVVDFEVNLDTSWDSRIAIKRIEFYEQKL